MNFSRGELAKLTLCPACEDSTENSQILYSRKDDDMLMSDIWHIYQCKSCQSIYVNPRPSDSSLSNLYSDYLTHRPMKSEQVECSDSLLWSLIRGYLKYHFGLKFDNKLELKVGAFIFSALPPLRQKLDRYTRNLPKAKPGSKLLDVGCGAGHFLEIAQKMGWHAQGCDFDPEVVSRCKSKGLDVRLGGLEAFEKNKGEFEILTMNQVLEHIPDQKKLIKNCYSYLKNGGSLWMALPNPTSIGQKVFKSSWAGIHPPYHLCLPNQKIIVTWLRQAGFKQIKLIKHGPHAKHNWKRSQNLIVNHKLEKPNNLKIQMGLACSNLISTINTYYDEETVIIAIK